MKKTHKFYRNLIKGQQYYLCTGKRCTFAEDVAWRWDSVDCPKCKKLRPK